MAFPQTRGEAWKGPNPHLQPWTPLGLRSGALQSHSSIPIPCFGKAGPCLPVSRQTGVPRGEGQAFSGPGKGAAQQGPTAPGRMVRILANGEIVPDDDPRVRTTTPPRSSAPRQSFLNRGHGAPLGGPGPRQQQAGARLGAAQSPFNDLNRQLVNMGFPQWHLGNHAVEPVTSILLLFLLMMLGVRGLLLVGLVYLVSHLSQR
uniref:Family with sequence similarity 241 member B n=4 Tax=Equus TaxID=9789 RepID=F6RZ94_HORSE